MTDKGYLVKDSIKGEKAFKVLFHTPCEVTDEKGVLELKADGKTLCRIRSSVKPVINQAYRSLYYLKREDSVCIAFSADAEDTVTTEIEVVRQEEV